jgi:hypothetical protein
MGDAGLDLEAAVKKVKKEKKAAKKDSKAGSKRTPSFLKNGASSTVAKPSSISKATPKSRVIPLGQKLKYVFDYVKQKRDPVSFEALKRETSVAIHGDVLAAVQKHEFLTVDSIAQTMQYKPKYALSCKGDLHRIIKQHPLGLLAAELHDAYPDAQQHLAELIEDEVVFECDSSEPTGTVVFPNEVKVPGGLPEESIRDLLFAVELPQQEADIDEGLQVAGITKANRSTARLKMSVIQDDRKPVREKKARKLRKVTNVHMADILGDTVPDHID